ncbi:Voltage-Dependent P/Q-Type Calcium Channel Subunit Alpha-1A [Manis pentadactyla]|nr:Voltage-Dependent P/Q-Type Calcium Channel Subunit Alpha-1A [Manis pentadactyla]
MASVAPVPPVGWLSREQGLLCSADQWLWELLSPQSLKAVLLTDSSPEVQTLKELETELQFKWHLIPSVQMIQPCFVPSPTSAGGQGQGALGFPTICQGKRESVLEAGEEPKWYSEDLLQVIYRCHGKGIQLHKEQINAQQTTVNTGQVVNSDHLTIVHYFNSLTAMPITTANILSPFGKAKSQNHQICELVSDLQCRDASFTCLLAPEIARLTGKIIPAESTSSDHVIENTIHKCVDIPDNESDCNKVLSKSFKAKMEYIIPTSEPKTKVKC